MTTEPLPPAEAVELHGTPYAGRHELQRCHWCAVSVLRPDPDDLDSLRAGEPLDAEVNQRQACRCVGGHQLHRCSTCSVLKVIRADASEQDPRAHGIPFQTYVWAITTLGFLMLFVSLSDLPAWVATTALWFTVAAALAGVVHLARRNRRRAEAREALGFDQ